MDGYSGFKTLKIELEGPLLTVALNRPDRLNAVGDGMHEELEAFFGMVAADRSVGAILLRGEGRAFCAGADVKELVEPPEAMGSEIGRVDLMTSMARRLVANILSVDQPIVAAVHGYALGLGANLALFCDVVIAAEDAVFADNHVTVGLVAGDGGTVMWPLLMPINTAKYYLLTGDRVDGVRAQELGLAFQAVPADDLLPTAKALALRLANGATLATRYTKRVANKIVLERVNLMLDDAVMMEGLSFLSHDHKEASAAFVEKRAPVFRGV